MLDYRCRSKDPPRNQRPANVFLQGNKMGSCLRLYTRAQESSKRRARTFSAEPHGSDTGSPPVLIEAGPDVGASLAARLTCEGRFQIGKPDIIRRPVCDDRDRMAATIVSAIDQQAMHAGAAR